MTKGKARAALRAPWIVRWRATVQAAFAVLWLSPFLRLHEVCAPVFHCYSCPLATFACPIGVLANFSALHVFPFLAVGTLLVVGALFGSLVCGYACPFGLFQDLLGRIPLRKFRLPAWTGYTRYAVLVGLVVAAPYFLGEASAFFFCRLCPAGALEAALPHTASLAIAGEPVVWPSAVKLVILIAFLAAAVFVWRPWCTLFCPLGAIFSVCNRVAMVYVHFHEVECNDCDVCRKRCNYGGAERRAEESRCVRCLECVGCQALTVGTIFGHRRGQPANGDGQLGVERVPMTEPKEDDAISAG